jgi:tRNA dimethylallyltransferase
MPQTKQLYSAIPKRVDLMKEAGLEQEARSLYHLRHLNALQTVGYRELFEYFDGKISFDRAIELIKRNTRRYARRQISWWSGDDSVRWFGTPDCDQFHNYLTNETGIFYQG